MIICSDKGVGIYDDCLIVYNNSTYVNHGRPGRRVTITFDFINYDTEKYAFLVVPIPGSVRILNFVNTNMRKLFRLENSNCKIVRQSLGSENFSIGIKTDPIHCQSVHDIKSKILADVCPEHRIPTSIDDLLNQISVMYPADLYSFIVVPLPYSESYYEITRLVPLCIDYEPAELSTIRLSGQIIPGFMSNSIESSIHAGTINLRKPNIIPYKILIGGENFRQQDVYMSLSPLYEDNSGIEILKRTRDEVKSILRTVPKALSLLSFKTPYANGDLLVNNNPRGNNGLGYLIKTDHLGKK